MAGKNKGGDSPCADGGARMHRRQRLAAALRENLIKRKAQARARRQPADAVPHGQANPEREDGSDNNVREKDEPSASRK